MSYESHPPTPKVELHPAHVWDCDECGRENFCRGVVMEISEQDREAMIARYGGKEEDWQTGNIISAPDEVTCAHCGQTFVVEEP
jgi:hypothetical protein